MTVLRPIENARVVGVKDGQMKLLRKLVLNKTCGHPECDRSTDDAHHCFARSLITNDSWWVEITEDSGEKRVIPHVIGLCRPHHEEVERHGAWIKLEDEVFNWYEEITRAEIEGQGLNYSEYGQSNTLWRLVGPLVPQPGEVSAPPKKRTRKQGAEKRARKTVSIAVPQDEQEDGAGILDDLIGVCREEWAGELGWKENVPAYYVLVAAMAKALQ